MRTLLKNGRILDPSCDRDEIGSVLLVDHQIQDVGPHVTDHEADEVFDCTDYWITPGLVDLHCNLRQPGAGADETMTSGTLAAAAGGYTTLCCMPNTEPALDNSALVQWILDRSAGPQASGVIIAPVGALTKGNQAQELTSLASMRRAGAVAFSDDSGPIEDAYLMTRAMETCLELGAVLLLHCDDPKLSRGGSINEGALSAMLGLKGIPRTAEEVATMRNCILALHHQCPVHIMRVSTWGAIETIRLVRSLRAPITCGVSPLHLIYTEDQIGEFDSRFKTLPPLRTPADVDLLIQGLQDGTIDCIASDHSPHAAYKCEVPFENAPFGASMLEATLALILTEITHKGHLSPLETIRKLSTRPAEILNLEGGTLTSGQGSVAQVCVIDPKLPWTFDRNRMFSMGKNVPFDGKALVGKAMLTFVGTEIYRDERFPESRYEIR